MRKQEFFIYLGAMLCAAVIALSGARDWPGGWNLGKFLDAMLAILLFQDAPPPSTPAPMTAAAPPSETLTSGEALKKALLAEADLKKAHHKKYEEVGERAWEQTHKPDFMRAITLATVKDTFNLLPTAEDVIQWVRDHPEEARRLMDGAPPSSR